MGSISFLNEMRWYKLGYLTGILLTQRCRKLLQHISYLRIANCIREYL
jgi:hypothetical protein